MRIVKWEIGRGGMIIFYGSLAIVCAALIVVMVFFLHQSAPSALAVSEGKEIGAWIWDPVNEMSTSTMAQLVDAASENHFNAIYLSIDAYLEIEAMPASAARSAALQNFSSAAYNFISLAHQKNISVDAEAGETDWGEPQNYQLADDIMDFVVAFNASHDGKFRGVQYDVESYSLPQYTTDPATVLAQYVGLVENLVQQDTVLAAPSNAPSASVSPGAPSGAQLPLTMIVPYFYASSSYGQIIQSLGQLPDGDGRMMVLAYRNTASGSDGSIALARPEITDADAADVSVLIAQETGDVQPASITFYGMSKGNLFSAVQEINAAFSSDRAYGGIAVDYLQSFSALQ
jgi:hypothetical protein